MKRTIELYGRLRDANLGSTLSVELAPMATARQALTALRSALGAKASLLSGCVLAGADNVLASSDLVPKKGRLAVLPPVCGG